MHHQAWSDGSFFPIINRSAATQLEAEATLIWTVDAASWHEAMALYHQWRGWKPYVPLDDDDVIYTAEEEAEASRLISAGVGIFTTTPTRKTNTAQGEARDERKTQ